MSRAHSPTFPSLHLSHNSFSNPSVALPTSQLILQSFRCFTYVTDHSPTLLSLLLRHKLCSFSKLSVTSPTSQILQPFRHFTYVTAHSPTFLSLLLNHKLFTYVTWRATHEAGIKYRGIGNWFTACRDWSNCRFHVVCQFSFSFFCMNKHIWPHLFWQRNYSFHCVAVASCFCMNAPLLLWATSKFFNFV